MSRSGISRVSEFIRPGMMHRGANFSSIALAAALLFAPGSHPSRAQEPETRALDPIESSRPFVRSQPTPAEVDAAFAALRKIGGSIRPVSRGSQHLEAEFQHRGRKIGDADLRHLAKLASVVRLNLRGTHISDKGLRHLKDLTALRRLHLERTSVGDAGVRHLAKLAQLEYLNLYGTKVTDGALEHLRGLKRLRRLYVWQTGVTEAGIVRLEKALPDLTVIRGVDLSKYPIYSEKQDEPKPSAKLAWMRAELASDAPKSENGLNTRVFFENKSGKRVKLYWVSYGNELVLYGELAPGATREQNSYARNTWLVTDDKDRPLGFFIVGEEISRAIIPEAGAAKRVEEKRQDAPQ